MPDPLEIYGTATVPSALTSGQAYPWLSSLARRAERHGMTGLLIIYNHTILDPWAVAGVLLGHTTRLVPLVATQPYSMPPFTAAKMISSLTSLYGRRIDLNVVTGAAPEELDQIDDRIGHDERYARAVEYLALLRRLLSTDEPLTWQGDHYRYRRLRMNSMLAENLRPRVFAAGSSEANRRLVEQAGDVMITHPEPVDMFAGQFLAARKESGREVGVRVGLIARASGEEAWAVALDGHHVDRAARIRTLLKRESQSDWNRRMANLAAEGDIYDDVYWTGAYSTGRTGAPLLVGNYDAVARYLQRYVDLGVSKLLLARVSTEDEFRHAREVLCRLRPSESQASCHGL